MKINILQKVNALKLNKNKNVQILELLEFWCLVELISEITRDWRITRHIIRRSYHNHFKEHINIYKSYNTFQISTL